jgi:mono/diheme cytochrome c family protein
MPFTSRLISAASVASVALALVTIESAPRAQTPAPPAGSAPNAGTAAAPQGGRGAVDPPGSDFVKRPAVVRQTPEAEQQMFLLPPGYKIELVLADPDIEDPVAVTFDGNGRMYVLEMRSYMRDVDGTGALDPTSRITRWEDTDGDGKYDRHTVFADHLVMPRMAFPLQDGAVFVLETDNRDLYKYTDTDGDGVADRKEIVYPGYGRVQNLEWQPGGMVWALDNWLYTTYNPYRLRLKPDGKFLREETDFNGGQWGEAQDNYGKIWWVDGGGETGPVNFQVPILYGAINVPDNFEPDFQAPWGAPGGIADMQGGMNRVRLPDGVLNHFTAAAGPEIYRGDRLPADLVGDLLFNEPVGRIVRRAKVVVRDGLTQLQNAYPKSEFVRSTDPLFRPVNVANAPDGTLYLMDMYVGIIQDAQFVGGPGSYLRRKVAQYDLDKQHNMGRIWRITYDGMSPDRTQPRMYSETAAQLVTHLTHPNGWWRDTAQKLLVLKQDKSVVPALKTMAQTSENALGRIHAMWTLEGLNALDAPLVRAMLKSADAKIRIQAIRASESLYKAGDKSFAADWRAMLEDADTDVAIQAMLTVNLLKLPDATTLIQRMVGQSQVRGIKEIGAQLLKPGSAQGQRPSLADASTTALNLSATDRAVVARGDATYRELCFSCHGNDGKGVPMAGATDGSTLAPPLAGSPRVNAHRDYVIRVLLAGLQGPVDGKTYNGGAVMVSMAANDDAWIADVASFVRNSFGNNAGFVTPAQVADVRKAMAARRVPWTVAELLPTVPTLLTNSAEWKLRASHNAAAAANAAGATPGARWDSGAPQAPGMWLEIELPAVTTISEVQIDSAAPVALFGRGRAAAGPGPAGLGAPTGAGPGRVGGAGAVPAAGAPAAVPAPAGVAAAPPAGGRGRGAAPPPASGPIGFSLQVSTDGASWSAPLAQGKGAATTVMAFKATPAKFIRITQTGTATNTDFWSVALTRVYQAGQ